MLVRTMWSIWLAVVVLMRPIQSWSTNRAFVATHSTRCWTTRSATLVPSSDTARHGTTVLLRKGDLLDLSPSRTLQRWEDMKQEARQKHHERLQRIEDAAWPRPSVDRAHESNRRNVLQVGWLFVRHLRWRGAGPDRAA